MPSNIIDKFV